LAPTAAIVRACSSVAPIRLTMPLGFASLAACIASPRRRTSRTPSSNSRAPAHQSAVYSPSDRPAVNGIARRSSPFSSSTRITATLVVKIPGCATSVRLTSSPAFQHFSESAKPSAASARSNTPRATGKRSQKSRPMPANCAPCPGKRMPAFTSG
jgi:hypothetical protein